MVSINTGADWQAARRLERLAGKLLVASDFASLINESNNAKHFYRTTD